MAEIKVSEGFNVLIPHDPIQNSRVEVILTLLPEAFRRIRGAGGNEFAKSRRIDENESVSILRADREIFHGYLRWVQPSLDSHEMDRFIGKEIRFEPALDECFQVRNVKKGTEPIDGLRDKLRELSFTSINTLRDEIRRHFDEVEKQTLQEQGLHMEAEKVTTYTSSREYLCILLQGILQSTGMPLQVAQLLVGFGMRLSVPLTIVPETWPGQELLEIKHLGSNAIVRINLQHPFYTEVYPSSLQPRSRRKTSGRRS
jgi:hypothetical protein